MRRKLLHCNIKHHIDKMMVKVPQVMFIAVCVEKHLKKYVNLESKIRFVQDFLKGSMNRFKEDFHLECKFCICIERHKTFLSFRFQK